jgi:NAD(P)H-quinone oxidoreductase subunit 4
MAIAQVPWLTILILLPLIAALVMPFLPLVRGTNNNLIRWYAISVGGLTWR